MTVILRCGNYANYRLNLAENDMGHFKDSSSNCSLNRNSPSFLWRSWLIVSLSFIVISCECTSSDCIGAEASVTLTIIKDGSSVFDVYDMDEVTVIVYDRDNNFSRSYSVSLADTATVLHVYLLGDVRQEIVLESLDTISLYGTGTFYDVGDRCCDGYKYSMISANGIEVCAEECTEITVIL